MDRILTAEPCRICGTPAYMKDADGAAHSCCVYWQDEVRAGKSCPACAASREAQRQREFRTKR